MVAERGVGSVYAAHLAELERLGEAESSDGRVALSLASAMDDRAGVVNLAATAKVLVELMKSIRVAAMPGEESELDRLRRARAERTGTGGSAATAR